MDHTRLMFLITVTVNKSCFSSTLRRSLTIQAVRQLSERWPLAGCVVTCTDTPTVIGVGRQ